jgi:hypothetical protein
MLPDDAPAGAVDQAAELLWQGWRFWDTGSRLYVFGAPITERLVAPDYGVGEWRFAAPPACYLQFPYQRLWARVNDAAAFEPLDGIFLSSLTLDDDTHEARLLAVLGLRPERPGASLVAHQARFRDEDAASHAGHPWRPGAEPFANAIPGGERQGYHTIVTADELEALALRALSYLDTHPHALRAAAGSATGDESHLAHVEVE